MPLSSAFDSHVPIEQKAMNTLGDMLTSVGWTMSQDKSGKLSMGAVPAVVPAGGLGSYVYERTTGRAMAGGGFAGFYAVLQEGREQLHNSINGSMSPMNLALAGMSKLGKKGKLAKWGSKPNDAFGGESPFDVVGQDVKAQVLSTSRSNLKQAKSMLDSALKKAFREKTHAGWNAAKVSVNSELEGKAREYIRGLGGIGTSARIFEPAGLGGGTQTALEFFEKLEQQEVGKLGKLGISLPGLDTSNLGSTMHVPTPTTTALKQFKTDLSKLHWDVDYAVSQEGVVRAAFSRRARGGVAGVPTFHKILNLPIGFRAPMLPEVARTKIGGVETLAMHKGQRAIARSVAVVSTDAATGNYRLGKPQTPAEWLLGEVHQQFKDAGLDANVRHVQKNLAALDTRYRSLLVYDDAGSIRGIHKAYEVVAIGKDGRRFIGGGSPTHFGGRDSTNKQMSVSGYGKGHLDLSGRLEELVQGEVNVKNLAGQQNLFTGSGSAGGVMFNSVLSALNPFEITPFGQHRNIGRQAYQESARGALAMGTHSRRFSSRTAISGYSAPALGRVGTPWVATASGARAEALQKLERGTPSSLMMSIGIITDPKFEKDIGRVAGDGSIRRYMDVAQGDVIMHNAAANALSRSLDDQINPTKPGHGDRIAKGHLIEKGGVGTSIQSMGHKFTVKGTFGTKQYRAAVNRGGVITDILAPNLNIAKYGDQLRTAILGSVLENVAGTLNPANLSEFKQRAPHVAKAIDDIASALTGGTGRAMLVADPGAVPLTMVAAQRAQQDAYSKMKSAGHGAPYLKARAAFEVAKKQHEKLKTSAARRPSRMLAGGISVQDISVADALTKGTVAEHMLTGKQLQIQGGEASRGKAGLNLSTREAKQVNATLKGLYKNLGVNNAAMDRMDYLQRQKIATPFGESYEGYVLHAPTHLRPYSDDMMTRISRLPGKAIQEAAKAGNLTSLGLQRDPTAGYKIQGRALQQLTSWGKEGQAVANTLKSLWSDKTANNIYNAVTTAASLGAGSEFRPGTASVMEQLKQRGIGYIKAQDFLETVGIDPTSGGFRKIDRGNLANRSGTIFDPKVTDKLRNLIPGAQAGIPGSFVVELGEELKWKVPGSAGEGGEQVFRRKQFLMFDPSFYERQFRSDTALTEMAHAQEDFLLRLTNKGSTGSQISAAAAKYETAFIKSMAGPTGVFNQMVVEPRVAGGFWGKVFNKDISGFSNDTAPHTLRISPEMAKRMGIFSEDLDAVAESLGKPKQWAKRVRQGKEAMMALVHRDPAQGPRNIAAARLVVDRRLRGNAVGTTSEWIRAALGDFDKDTVSLLLGYTRELDNNLQGLMARQIQQPDPGTATYDELRRSYAQNKVLGSVETSSGPMGLVRAMGAIERAEKDSKYFLQNRMLQSLEDAQDADLFRKGVLARYTTAATTGEIHTGAALLGRYLASDIPNDATMPGGMKVPAGIRHAGEVHLAPLLLGNTLQMAEQLATIAKAREPVTAFIDNLEQIAVGGETAVTDGWRTKFKSTVADLQLEILKNKQGSELPGARGVWNALQTEYANAGKNGLLASVDDMFKSRFLNNADDMLSDMATRTAYSMLKVHQDIGQGLKLGTYVDPFEQYLRQKLNLGELTGEARDHAIGTMKDRFYAFAANAAEAREVLKNVALADREKVRGFLAVDLAMRANAHNIPDMEAIETLFEGTGPGTKTGGSPGGPAVQDFAARMAGSWKNIPKWQKAGIITAGVIAGGAIIKNAFFPGTAPSMPYQPTYLPQEVDYSGPGEMGTPYIPQMGGQGMGPSPNFPSHKRIPSPVHDSQLGPGMMGGSSAPQFGGGIAMDSAPMSPMVSKDGMDIDVMPQGTAIPARMDMPHHMRAGHGGVADPVNLGIDSSMVGLGANYEDLGQMFGSDGMPTQVSISDATMGDQSRYALRGEGERLMAGRFSTWSHNYGI